jgi:trimethylamine:corrinoid methyltransferase-like protein
MSTQALRLPPLLSSQQCQRIHEEALGLIERIGTQVRDAALRQKLTGQAGVTLRADRAWAERFAAGFEFSDQTLAIPQIEEVLRTGANFLEQEQTLTQYQRMYWMPRLFDYGMMGSYLAG